MIDFEEQLSTCLAISLYTYNVSPGERAEKLYKAFQGNCAEPDELLILVDNPHWATQMAAPTALAYLRHAIDRYGTEAQERTRVNLHFDR